MTHLDRVSAHPQEDSLGESNSNNRGDESNTTQNVVSFQDARDQLLGVVGFEPEGSKGDTQGIFATTAPQYWSRNLPVIPLFENQKRPSILDWSQFGQRMPTETEQSSWLAAHAKGNIGLPLGAASGMVALDIDTTDPTIIEVIEAATKVKSPWKRVGAKGYVAMFRFNGEKTFRVKDRENRTICELLSAGTQVVLPPSQHPDTGRPYTANCDLLGVVDQLTVLPPDFEKVLRAALEGVGVKLGTKGYARVTEWTPKTSRDNRYATVCGMYATDVTKGRLTLAEAIEAVWAWPETFSEQVPGDNLDPQNGVNKLVRFLVKNVREHGMVLRRGWDKGLSDDDKNALGLDFGDDDQERTYEEIMADLDVGLDTATDMKAKMGAVNAALHQVACASSMTPVEAEQVLLVIKSSSGLKLSLPALRKELAAKRKARESNAPSTETDRFVYVGVIERFVDVETGRKFRKEAMNDLNRHVRDRFADGLLETDQFRKVESITYYPGGDVVVEENGRKMLNLWRGTSLVPVAGDPKPFLDHIQYVIPNKVESEHVLDVMAYQVQNPGKKVRHALLIQGAQGIGKTMITLMVAPALGVTNVVDVANSVLQKPYNDWMAGKTLVVIEELMMPGRLEIYNKLKPWITNDMVQIEEKNVPAYTTRNVSNFFCFTNHRNAIVLEDDDRRFFVVFSPAIKKPPSYYVGLMSWVEGGGDAIIYHYLLNRQIEHFNPSAPPPMTDAKMEMTRLGKPELTRWVLERLEDRRPPFDRLLLSAREALIYLPSGVNCTEDKLGRHMAYAGCRELGQVRVPDPDQRPEEAEEERRKLRKLRLFSLRDHEVLAGKKEGELRDIWTRQLTELA